MRVRTIAIGAALAGLLSCKSKRASEGQEVSALAPPKSAPVEAPPPGGSEQVDRTRRDQAKDKGVADDEKKQAGAKAQFAAAEIDAPADGLKNEPKVPEAQKREEAAGPTRAWFPETFLFEPLVVTDDRGTATVPVRVPDRLTTWRVLALAHSRSGAQGGATASFLGTLPAYVDPVVPPFLVMGDEVRLPIQMVNTTAAAIPGALRVEAENAGLTSPQGARTIPAQGSLLEYATLRATKPGAIKLRVGLGGTDAVLRTIDVVPAGKPILTTRSGTLAAPRTLAIEGPAGADPATSRARLMVFPGALALLRSELGVSIARGGLAEDAYALLLAGRAPALLAALGDRPDAAVLRDLALVTAQRAIRHARTLDVASATELTAAALAHPQNPVLARLGERAADLLGHQQRPDGTFAGGTGWTLQRVLVATAEGTRAVLAATGTTAAKQRAQAVAIRAAGAFERNAEAVPDGFTAAVMLASGAIPSGPLADKLRKRVSDGLKKSTDGAQYLDVPEGVVRADGSVPTRAEATALAVLALDGTAGAPLADLGTTLLGSYTPVRGWGDGHANLSCMQAVLALFKTPVPANVTITLTLDGTPVTSGTLDRAALRDVLVLEAAAPGLAGTHEWAIKAEPAVAGLGYALALTGYVPWDKQPVEQGLELAVPETIAATVGKPVELAVTAIAPAGMELHIRHALPAGVQVDRPSLDALVSAGTLARYETADGTLDLYAPALAPGQVLAVKYKAIATLAGTLHSAASLIESGVTAVQFPPSTWTVK